MGEASSTACGVTLQQVLLLTHEQVLVAAVARAIGQRPLLERGEDGEAGSLELDRLKHLVLLRGFMRRRLRVLCSTPDAMYLEHACAALHAASSHVVKCLLIGSSQCVC